MKAQSNLEKTRIYNRWPVAREGVPFIAVGLFFTLLSYLVNLPILFAVLAVLTLFIAWFFRDPDRKADVAGKAVLAPADGRIIEIRKYEDSNNPLGEPAIKVGIFMTIFNVHVNRIPASGRVTEIRYYPGKFFSANLDKASRENERNTIVLETEDGKRLMTIQIAGLIARRIACWIKEDDPVIAGNRFGLIRFGSRLDTYVPYDSQIMVQQHQRVRAGQTTLGYLS